MAKTVLQTSIALSVQDLSISEAYLCWLLSKFSLQSKSNAVYVVHFY